MTQSDKLVCATNKMENGSRIKNRLFLFVLRSGWKVAQIATKKHVLLQYKKKIAIVLIVR